MNDASRRAYAAIVRTMVFVDFWNFTLSLGQGFHTNWVGLGQWMTERACQSLGLAPGSYLFEGMMVYTSFDPGSGAKHRNWATGWLAGQPNVGVVCLERRRRIPPNCRNCGTQISNCPSCNFPLSGTTEKGVDTFLATDMIRLAWEDAYEIAVLVTSDSDLVPCVDYLVNQRNRRVIQAGFPPRGVEISKACSSSFDVGALREEIRRA